MTHPDIRIALTLILPMLASVASATTYYSGKKASAAVRNSVTWYTDLDRTAVADPQPTLTDGDGNEYVFVVTDDKWKWSADTVPGKCYFGCDGTTVGSAAKNLSVYANGGQYTFSDLTLIGANVKMNAKGTFSLNGNIDLPAGKSFTLYSYNNAYDNGYQERCFAIGANAVLTSGEGATLQCDTQTQSKDASLTFSPYFEFAGDLTGFKGKISVTKPTSKYGDGAAIWTRCKMTSASAFGDTSVPLQNALTLAHDVYLEIDPAVTQSSARGITLDLSAAQRAGVVADANGSWTLTAPVYGSVGTFVKRGTGTVTLDGSLATENIEVKEGKLVFGANATYAANPQILVKAGASVAFLKPVPGATVTYESGAAADPLSVAYDAAAKTTTPLAVTAADAAALKTQMGGRIALALSNAIAIPDAEAHRFALMTVAGGDLTADDFRNATPATSWGLPRMSLEVETDDGAGVQTVVLVVRPTYRWSGTKSLMTASNWGSGAPTPYAGADYYINGYATGARTGTGSQISDFDFAGGSLSLTSSGDKIIDYAQNFSFGVLRLFAGTSVSSAQSNEKACRLIGTVHVDVSSTGSAMASIAMPGTKNCEMRTTLTGGGDLRLDVKPGTWPLKMTGASPDFKGGLVFLQAEEGQRTISATNGLAFGGALEEFRADAVNLVTTSVVEKAFTILAEETLTVDAANRGWTVTNTAFSVAEGKTLVFKPARLTAGGTLYKTGAGTLALGCPIEGTSAVSVEEGFVQPADATSTAELGLTFAAGAGIRVSEDGLTAAPQGLVAASFAPAAAGGKIAVAVDLSSETAQERHVRTVAICSVPTGHADLADVLSVNRIRGYATAVSSETSGDRTVYSVTCSPCGFAIFIR